MRAAQGSRAASCQHLSGELLTSTIGFVFRAGGSPHLTENQEAPARASTGTLSLLNRPGLLATRLEQHDYTWLHFHFPASPVDASIQRWRFYPEGAAEHRGLCICQCRGEGGTETLPGLGKVCVHSGRTGPVRTCTHTEVQTKRSSADERPARLEETQAGKEMHF